MPDLLAGTTVKAGDTPIAVSNSQAGVYTATITAFGVATTGGTYADCGVAFVAPTTGRVLIPFSGQLANGTASAAAELSPFVRTGATVGAGATFLASVIDNKVRSVAVAINSIEHLGSALFVSGLTAGSSYNVRLDHRVSGGTGSFGFRSVSVIPLS